MGFLTFLSLIRGWTRLWHFEKLHQSRVIVPLIGVNGLRNRTVIGALAVEYVHISEDSTCVPHE